jgi:HEAT repeat protein
MAEQHNTTRHLSHETLLRIIALLGHCPTPDAIDMLRAVAAGADADLRVEAIRGLGRLQDMESLPLLIYTLRRDKAPRVRAVAAEALGMFARAIAVDPLIGALQDRHPLVRRAVTRALTSLGPLAKACLQRAVKHHRWALSLDSQRLVWQARRLLRGMQDRVQEQGWPASGVTSVPQRSAPHSAPSRSTHSSHTPRPA